MKIAFDGRLFLNKEKTGIAWNAHNLLMELLKHSENQYTLLAFKNRQISAGILNEYEKAGCNIEFCNWFYDTFYKLIWMMVPLPHHFFFRTQADIMQFFNYAVPPGVIGNSVTFIYDMSYKSCPHTVSRKTLLWLKLCMKKTCKNADHIVTVSEFSKGEIIKYLKIPKKRISVVPCAVDHTIYHSEYTQQQIEKVLKKYGIKQDYFLYLGTIEPRKNLARVIAAYAKLCKERGNVPQLVLAGRKGWRCNAIYKKVRRLKLENRVIFTGYVEQKDSPILMCGAVIFVFPSLYEGFGMPPLEAMACGTPVIVSNTTSLPEVVGDAGIMVNPESESEIYKAMRLLLENKRYRTKLAQLGKKRAEKFTWKKSAEIMDGLYKKLCGDSKILNDSY